MYLKIKKARRFVTKIYLVKSSDHVGDPVWRVSVAKNSVFKELEGLDETAVKYWLVSRGYSYTQVYR